MEILHALTCLVAVLLAPLEEPRGAVAPNTTSDQVSLSLHEVTAIEFSRDGDRLAKPAKAKVAEGKKGAVRIKFEVTTDSPVPPPRVGATRPYLDIENGFEKTLHFRVKVRLKGSKDFIELPEAKEPLAAGDHFLQCWEFDSRIEEAVISEFKLSNAKVD